MIPPGAAHPTLVSQEQQQEFGLRPEGFTVGYDGAGDVITGRRGRVVSEKSLQHWPITFLGIRWGEGMWNDVRRRAPYYW